MMTKLFMDAYTTKNPAASFSASVINDFNSSNFFIINDIKFINGDTI